jgi:hypothetical protein
MKRAQKLVSSNEEKRVTKQHKQPCSDCPFRRDALRGWLGGAEPEVYARMAHSDQVILCHTLLGAQCAGSAIYRANVCKLAASEALRLPPDRKAVFTSPSEFVSHHGGKPYAIFIPSEEEEVARAAMEEAAGSLLVTPMEAAQKATNTYRKQKKR